jgi:DNA-binding winged helix-turn-helix (wHTH) protein/tetratricopeptide (TPR) repeat protein
MRSEQKEMSRLGSFVEKDAHVYEFADFQLNSSEFLLLRGKTPVPLPKRAFQMLLVLVQRSPHLVEKSELIDAVWKGAFVEEGNVAVIISMLRKALGGERGGRVYIETVSKIGYRFVGEVRKVVLKEANTEKSDSESVEGGQANLLGRFRGAKKPVSVATGIGLLALVCLTVSLGAMIRAAKPNVNRPPFSVSNSKLVQPKVETANPEATQNYLAGQYFGKRRTHESLRRSVEYYQQAVMKDPQNAKAYSGLSDSYSSLATFETQPIQSDYSLAKAAAVRAVQLDDSLAESHTSLAIVSFRFEWNWGKAETELRRAMQLDPHYLMTYIIYANCLAAQGRLDEALEQASRAEQLDPLSTSATTDVGRIRYFRREYDQSITELVHSIDLDPYYERSHTRLGEVYAVVGDYPRALHEFEVAAQLSTPDPYLEGFTGYVEARSGKPKLAREKLARLIERSHREYVPAFSMALISIGLGDHVRALDWLEQAYRERSEIFSFAKVDPLLDPERSDPRFEALLLKMGLGSSPRGSKAVYNGDGISRVTFDSSGSASILTR